MIYITDFLVFLSQHPLATFCGISAFFISCWTGYVEKHTLWDVFMSSIVSVLSALSILAILFKGNHYHLWLSLVGVIVGFIGPHKIRTVVLAILENIYRVHKKIPTFIKA
ncbi:TPA: phage holin family protein, partial [Salmonella enterica]